MVHFQYWITFQVVPSLVVFIHPQKQARQVFFTSTESRWGASSCQNCYVNTDYVFLYFAVFTFFWLSCLLADSLLCLCFNFPQISKFLSIFLHGEFYVASSIYIVPSFSRIESSLQFMLVAVVAMLIRCSVINHGAWLKLYTHAIWSEHKMHMNFAHRTLNIIEIKAKKLHRHHKLYKPMLIHVVDFTCTVTLCHTV